MKVQELSVGDIFYTCYAHTKKVLYGPCRLDGSAYLEPYLLRYYLEPYRLLRYKATGVVDRSITYLSGDMECIKVGNIPNEAW